MGKDPAILFYTSDFLSGTSFLNYEEKGQYITLLCQQHQSYEIPENHMINVCGSLDSPVMQKFTRTGNGFYYNERMRIEGEKRRSFCDSRSNNKSGRPSKKIIRKSYDNHMGNHMENENENEIKDIKTIKRSPKKFNFDEVWDLYPKGHKIGKDEARGYFNSTVKTPQDLYDVHKALYNYVRSDRVLSGFVMNGCKFFSLWKDFVDYENPQKDTLNEKLKKMGVIDGSRV